MPVQVVCRSSTYILCTFYRPYFVILPWSPLGKLWGRTQLNVFAHGKYCTLNGKRFWEKITNIAFKNQHTPETISYKSICINGCFVYNSIVWSMQFSENMADKAKLHYYQCFLIKILAIFYILKSEILNYRQEHVLPTMASTYVCLLSLAPQLILLFTSTNNIPLM